MHQFHLQIRARNGLHKRLRNAALIILASIGFSSAQAQLSGSYTIGSSGDFKTFSAAIDSLTQVGISGAVELTAASGTYNEQLIIPDISGTSTSNTLTFSGAGNGTGGTLLTSAVKNSSGSVVEINNANNIIFRNMRISQTECGDTRYAVNLISTTNITFDNCHILAPHLATCSNLSISWGLNALHTESAGHNIFTNNKISGGSQTVDCNYYSNGYDVFTKNYFTGGYYNTIRFYEGEGIEFLYNTIDSADYNENRALSAENCSGLKIAYNDFLGYNMSSAMGFVEANLRSNTIPTEVYNNFMNLRSPNMRAGVAISYYNSNPAYVDFIFAHNTIHVPDAPYAEALYIESEYTSGLKILNNIITRAKGGITMSYLNPKAGDMVEGNNFYNGNSGDLVQLGRNIYADIKDYKAEAANYGFGLYDQSINVTYASKTDLHLDQFSVSPWGPAVFTTDDIDRDKRCLSFATAGADESYYSGNDNYSQPSQPSFSVPSSVYYKNPVVFENSATAGLAAKYTWYINNKPVTDSVHLSAVLEGPEDTIKLVAYNCGGKDSASAIVRVLQPSAVPVTDFISNKSLIKQGETVKLFDNSTEYPSEWQWEITPKTVYKNDAIEPAYEFVDGSDNSQNLYVRFLYGGKYNICLTASNIIGSGLRACISNYMEVVPSVNLGTAKNISDSAGYIYDNGGPDKPYTNAQAGRDRIIIGECADSVFLVFKKFDVGCDQNEGDFVRIFEGTNNRGRALHCINNRTTWGFGPGLTGSPTSGCPNTCSPISATHIDTFKAKGAMYIEMESGIFGSNFDGFEAYYWIKPKVQAPPVARFSSLDSVCINSAIIFQNESSGDDLRYLWDADGDGIYEPLGKNVSYAYFAVGTYTVRMVAVNCGGSDTFSKDIEVFLPKAPVAQFYTDNTTPTTDDVVSLTADVAECVDDYSWTFTPAVGNGEAIFVNGTSERSANPDVIFTDTGCYSVTLHVLNTSGEDEIKLACYIHVRSPYCKPVVKTLSQDIGISEVQFGSYSNISLQAESEYSDYTNIPSKAIYAEKGVTYPLTIKRNTNKHKTTRTVWIDWNYDGIFDDATEKVAEELNSNAKEWNVNIDIPAIIITGVTKMRVAINQGSYSNKACGKNEFGEYEDYRLYIWPDVTGPVISLFGDSVITLEQGNSYTDAGATAFDNHDGDVSALINTRKPADGFYMIPGTYFYRYNVQDLAGNQARQVSRKIVITQDKTAPKLIIADDDTLEAIVFSSTAYTPPAIIRAEDLVDGDVEPMVHIDNPVKMTVVDTFTVIYSVSDKYKNKAEVARTVIVKDTAKPVITVFGDNPYYLNAGDNYVDAGVTITDNYYAVNTLNDALKIKNNLDKNTPGTYEFVYNVVDGSRNAAIEKKRTIIVRDMIAPIVTITDTIMETEVLKRFEDPGFLASDNFDAGLIKTVSGSFYESFVNGIPTILDTFTIVYSATDHAGNTTSKTRIIIVKDFTEPRISLKGTPNATVCRWGTYTDAGYSVEDNFYADDDITVTTEGDWSDVNGPSVEGPYSLRYKAVEKSGNIGYSDWRTIWVRSPYEYPCSTLLGIGDEKALAKAISIYPNPNCGKFTVQADMPKSESISITVSNLMGQEVAVITDEMLNDNKFQVDLSNQPAGVYLLNIFSNHLTTTKRIVISK